MAKEQHDHARHHEGNRFRRPGCLRELGDRSKWRLVEPIELWNHHGEHQPKQQAGNDDHHQRIEHGQAGDAPQLIEPRGRIDERLERATQLTAFDAGDDGGPIRGGQRSTLRVDRGGQRLARFHPPTDPRGELTRFAGKIGADPSQLRFERETCANECPDFFIDGNEVGKGRRNRIAACGRVHSPLSGPRGSSEKSPAGLMVGACNIAERGGKQYCDELRPKTEHADRLERAGNTGFDQRFGTRPETGAGGRGAWARDSARSCHSAINVRPK